MRHLLRTTIFVIGLMVLLGASIYPPEKNLRLGKDLAGGVSLVYAVQINPGDDAGEILGKTIEVLKRRIDPDGQLDIAMVAQGRDRIEITMPLPTERVTQLRRAFDAALTDLGSSEIDEAAVERIMRLPAAQRDTRIIEVGGGQQLQTALAEAASAFDLAAQARLNFADAQAVGSESDLLDELATNAALAEIDYEDAREAVLAAFLNPERVERALRLSDVVRMKRDLTSEDPVAIPSARQRAWDSLLETYPDRADELESVRAEWELYETERRTLDDPNDLIRLLRGAGVLAFRITVDPGDHPEEERLRSELRERGPRNVRANDAAWYKVNQVENWYDTVQDFEVLRQNPGAFFATRGYTVEEFDGEYYMLCWDQRGYRLTQAEGEWSVASAFQGVDQLGRPAINFTMDARGSGLLGNLTGAHVQDQMAVLLDDQVYTAPNLISRISSNGQITGEFTPEERAYVINVLSAGSLQAKLSPEPISVSTIGPDLGLDNLKRGMNAGIAALIAVSVFMFIYYFLCGGVAVISLICNALIILGLMSLNRAAFTLPGIAGVILTFGMAVDANVLIYERVREEMRGGADTRQAVRLGFSKALSSIVDGNVTNLIVCFVLAYTGTQEIRGFAITLGIGVVGTMFSALVVSKMLMWMLVDWVKIRKLPMLPTVLPIIDRTLEPKIDWMKAQYVFIAISTIYVGIGLSMVVFQGSKMLDNEFLGGTQVTIRTKDDASGNPIKLGRAEVQERVQAIAADLSEEDELKVLRTADVLVVSPDADGVTSDTFTIKTTATNTDRVVGDIQAAFEDVLESLPPVDFDGLGADQLRDAPVYRVITGTLGDDTDRPEYRNSIGDWTGGAAVIVENIEPAVSAESLLERIRSMSEQNDFREIASRPRDLIVLRGTEDAVQAAVVLTLDDAVTFFDNEERFDREVALAEWNLVRTALTQASSPASVQSFSPAIADTFRAQAVVAVALSFLLILIYIWVRFGSVRYSLAAIITLLHDVLTVIGLIALAEIVYDFDATRDVARSLGVLPFKIDLSLVAAILTIIGYSLNDTIIIMDRIRENRGKLSYASRKVVNLSINQTVSRTVITSGTTLIATLLLYTNGGEGVRAFSFALMVGIFVGTYSSIAVAAPLVWSAKHDKSEREADAEAAKSTE
ncbi:MAG: protein translocase subunit SecD [Planctomycetota bacterium]